jgi:hypothetical protein
LENNSRSNITEAKVNRRSILQTALATITAAWGLMLQSKEVSAATQGLLEIRAIEGMGRGVFARAPIKAGTVVIRDYTLPVPEADIEHTQKTVFKDYYFVSGEADQDGAVAYLALGIASLLNHSGKAPNVEQQWDLTKEGWVVEFTALRNIRAGEQLFFDYEFGEDEIPAWADNYPKK